MQGVHQEPNLVNYVTHQRMTRRISQLQEEKLFAEMQASKELDKCRKTPEQKGASSTTEVEEETLSLKEQVRKLTEKVQLLMTSSQERGGGELNRELCGLADAHGKNTMMSTMSSDEMSWMDEQVLHSTASPAWDHLTERKEVQSKKKKGRQANDTPGRATMPIPVPVRVFFSVGGCGRAIARNTPLRTACCSDPLISTTNRCDTAIYVLSSRPCAASFHKARRRSVHD